MANPHAVLESELKYYSCVTKGVRVYYEYIHNAYIFTTLNAHFHACSSLLTHTHPHPTPTLLHSHTYNKQTTIRFKHNGKEYDLDVVETLGPKDEPVDAIRVQVGRWVVGVDKRRARA